MYMASSSSSFSFTTHVHTIITTNTTNNNKHVTFAETFHPAKCHPFGQVSLANNISGPHHYYSNHASSSLVAITGAAQARNKKSTSKKSTSTSTSTSSGSTILCHVWKEIQGCNDWENLLEPLHPLLRSEVIRYGELVGACYKAFEVDPKSKRYLNCKYGKKRMLKEVGMGKCGYEVSKYIYATAEQSRCERWIGYVAVAREEWVKRLGRRDIVVTFRGTVTKEEWMANMMSRLTAARVDPQNPREEVKVESGFLSLYTWEEKRGRKVGVESCREQVLGEVSRLLRKHRGESMSITVAGHSMGSALALLLAYDIAELGLNRTVPITVFSFGGPRVGNLQFKRRCHELGVKVLRIANVKDPITNLPGFLFNDKFRVPLIGFAPSTSTCYAHVGVDLLLDFFNLNQPSSVHHLDSYLRLLTTPTPPPHHSFHSFLSLFSHPNPFLPSLCSELFFPLVLSFL